MEKGLLLYHPGLPIFDGRGCSFYDYSSSFRYMISSDMI